jgi:Domain of Unknown Function (DUF1080)
MRGLMKRKPAISAVAMTTAMATGLVAQTAPARQTNAPTGYTDTPFLPGSKWRVHDDARPRPPVITPGTFSAPQTPGQPPSDAVVLFDGTSLAAWRTEQGAPAKWKVGNGYLEVLPGGGDILTRGEFGDSQFHIEWSAPSPPKGVAKSAGTAAYSCWDSNNPTYADGQAAAIYGQSPPLVNACRPPGEWQQYDIVYSAPRFKDGKIDVPGFVTVFPNGMVVQNHTQILGTTQHRALPKLVVHGPKGPLRLQDHGDPVRFRNIWIRPLGEVQ